MLTPADYLSLSTSDAAVQWRGVTERSLRTGRRQEDFTPVETLLCLAASLVVNHRAYGGSTSHLAAEPVQSLSQLFRRPPSSILAKMANLDGSRRNGARSEIVVSSVLLHDPHRLADLYRVVFRAARTVSIGPDILPDFLALESNDSGLLLLGQEELSEVEVEAAIEERAVSWQAARSDLEAMVTERLLVAAARVGQHRFAGAVLQNHGHSCGFCGLRQPHARIGVRGLLVASHVKPWRVSAPRERLDPRNGIAACPTHDVAFDTGLITVNGGLRIHVTSSLRESARHERAAAAVFGRPPLFDRLSVGQGGEPPDKRYLEWHRDNVYLAEAG